ncbi:MAG TPA: NADH-quinone oxidoreductase subunit A [Dehalococcoidia bacterium]|nr:NADH-quinone oxidoreductase subunit A [Dehalococcoidia bacterium]
MISDFFAGYVAVLIAGILGFLLVFGALFGNMILSPRQRTRTKGLAYECGMLPIGRSRTQVHFRYYLFAILFLIFDIEAVFLFPWAISLYNLGETAFYEMLVFVFILGFALLYAWKKGVLRWGKEGL